MKGIAFWTAAICLCFLGVGEVEGELIPPTKVVEALSSGDFSVVDNTLKYLGYEQGIGGGFKRFQVLQPSMRRSAPFYIFGLSWIPYKGHIVLMDSAGNILGKREVGYIKSVCLRQLEESGDDVLVVDAIFGTGTGFEEDHYYVFKVRKEGLLQAWEAISYKNVYLLAANPKENFEITASIRFEDLNNDGIDEVIYSIHETRYLYNLKTQKLSVMKTKRSTRAYVLKDDKYVFWKELKE